MPWPEANHIHSPRIWLTTVFPSNTRLCASWQTEHADIAESIRLTFDPLERDPLASVLAREIKPRLSLPLPPIDTDLWARLVQVDQAHDLSILRADTYRPHQWPGVPRTWQGCSAPTALNPEKTSDASAPD